MRNRGNKIAFLIIFFVIIVGAGYIYTSAEFEQEKPTITIDSELFWNRKAPLSVELVDNRGLKSYELILSDGQNHVMLDQQLLEKGGIKNQEILVKYPKKSTLNPSAKKFTLTIRVTDTSFWNYFAGNTQEKIVHIIVDYKRPRITVLSNSYSITQGGSALVIFQASDDNLEELYIDTGKKHFKVQPYKEEGYYASLIAWSFMEKDFNAKIIAKDKAGNTRKTEIPFYLKNHNYKVSWIRARDKFIEGKITDLIENSDDFNHITAKFEKLKAINETMRLSNEAKIHGLAENLSTDILTEWKIKRFYPLKNAQRVASFGDERHYYYKTKKNEVSHAYHVGYDLASTKMAPIKTSNAGIVVYAEENGIYGNMPMINHGLGLYTLYGHCSSLLVSEGDEVSAGESIAKTGKSGLALGDHLHFGMLVQGVEVRPVEWFDKNWIRKNIDKMFKDADVIIAGK